MNRKIAMPLVAAALVAAATVAGLSGARANGATCTAYLGGLETGKASVPELVVFNTTSSSMSLALVLRDAEGRALPGPAEPLVVDGFHSAFVSLSARLATAGAGGKPYEGRFSAELSGAAPFSSEAAVVHVTQYVGKPGKGLVKPAKPKAAYIVRPLFVSSAP